MGDKANADFSGWATKAGLKCADGRTIMPEAFAHMDGKQIPLVWQHGHDNPENVLGHAILEARPEGMYAYGFFNDTNQGQMTKALVQHKDINSLSIWANQLVERSKQVFHGAIRELSLVLAGANPGALIENVAIAHGADGTEILDDEAVIYTGLGLEGALIEHAAEQKEEEPKVDEKLQHAEAGTDTRTVQDVFESMSDEQKQVVYFMVGAALEDAQSGETGTGTAAQSAITKDDNSGGNAEANKETQDDQKDSGNLAHQDNNEEGTNMTHNVFENHGKDATGGAVLTHDALMKITDTAKKLGSLKDAFLAHATEYGIENIDVLFPDAKAIATQPELIARRQEWVNVVWNGVRKSPFSRIKTVSADLTLDEARAKGYVKGSLKKDEWFRLAKRVTTPTTIYKKQKLDRDDIIDITDLDVVAFLKGEMRIMLDEEVARAILVGDGREVDDDDKVNEGNIRPIAHDDDFFTHKVIIPANVGGEALVEAILRARSKYRGSGRPTLFLTEDLLTDLILAKDKMGRRLYDNEGDLASALRVSAIQTVDVMEDQTADGGDLLAVLVNLADYTVGADRGGNVAMFDDFDIDYNQYKYLIETRLSGSLTKFKSAQAFIRSAGSLVAPAVPGFNTTTGVLTVPATTGVIYRNGDTDAVLTSGNQAAIDAGESVEVVAEPDNGYYFAHNTDNDWTFTRNV